MQVTQWTRFCRETGKSVWVTLTLIVVGGLFREGLPLLGDSWPLIRIILVFALVATLIRKHWDVGLALLLAAVAMGVLFPLDAGGFADVITFGYFNPHQAQLQRLAPQALELILMVFLINVLGGLLGARNALKGLILSLAHLLRDFRYVAAVIPSIIGLLPTPGGALISAPLVDEIGRHVPMSAETKTASNFWFRHVWEFWWPLYPAMIFVLNDDALGIRASRFMLALMPLTVPTIVGGWWFMLRRIPRPGGSRREREGTGKSLLSVATTLWPVGVVVAALLLAPRHLQTTVFVCALLAVNLVLAFQKSISGRELLSMIRGIRIGRLAGLIAAVYLLRGMFVVTDAAAGLPALLSAGRMPVPLICFLVPWLVGLLTGYTLAGIVTTLPLLMPFVAPTGEPVRLDLLMLLYTGNFAGVMISPTHLCLTLTRGYFKADFSRVYGLLIGPYAVMLAGIAVLGFVLNRLG